jgi:hypothetical protein
MQKEIVALKERNKKVEADKAWETSITRRMIIAIITYLLVVLFLYTIKIQKPWLNAIVPTVGFILSTLTLPFFKRWWIEHTYK